MDIGLESSVVEHLTGEAGVPGSIPGPVIYFHLYFFIPSIPGTKCSKDGKIEQIQRNTKMDREWNPASLVRCSTTALSRWIFTVHLARPTTFLLPRRHTRQTQVDPVRTYWIKCLSREGHGTKCSRNGRNEHIQRNTNENIWLDRGNQIRDPCITRQVLYHWAIHADIYGPSSPNFHITCVCRVCLRGRRLCKGGGEKCG